MKTYTIDTPIDRLLAELGYGEEKGARAYGLLLNLTWQIPGLTRFSEWADRRRQNRINRLWIENQERRIGSPSGADFTQKIEALTAKELVERIMNSQTAPTSERPIDHDRI